MNRLRKIVQTAVPGTGVQFLENVHGSHGIRRFLVDVLAMANASVEGNRYIVTGISVDKNGKRRFLPEDPADFVGNPSYEALVAEFIEPPIRIKYRSVSVQDQNIGIYEIGDCQDKPYMMRIDYSEHLRRGDAYVRIDNASIKMGRRMLLLMLEDRPRYSVPEDTIEVGFPGEAILKKLRMPTVDMHRLPSVVERSKLSQLIDVREKTKNSGATTTMARLMHMRLFGADTPYEEKSPTGLVEEMSHVCQNYELDDQYFLFEENAQRLQLVVCNLGGVPVRDASLTLVMPVNDAIHVATRLPATQGHDQHNSESIGTFADYPVVSISDNEIRISGTLHEIPAGAPVDVFELPLRMCVGSELDGKRLTMRYKLYGSNLRQPVEGRLTLSFGAMDN